MPCMAFLQGFHLCVQADPWSMASRRGQAFCHTFSLITAQIWGTHLFSGFFFCPCDSMQMTKWASPKRNSKFQPGYHELIESPLKIRYPFSPCFKSILSFDTCWPKIIIYSVQPVVKRTQREILAKLFLQSFNWAWFYSKLYWCKSWAKKVDLSQ